MKRPDRSTTLMLSVLELESGNPLPRAAFLLVFFAELCARLLLGQGDGECWQAPLRHAFAACLGVRLFCWAIGTLYERFRPPASGRG